MTSLNPVYKIGRQVGEGLRLHRGYSKQEALKRATELWTSWVSPSPRSASMSIRTSSLAVCVSES